MTDNANATLVTITILYRTWLKLSYNCDPKNLTDAAMKLFLGYKNEIVHHEEINN